MIEKVNPSHPDKVADRIAGALVDLAYKKQENPKIAVEVLIGHGTCHIITETSVGLKPYEVEKIVERITGHPAALNPYALVDNEPCLYVDLLQVAQDPHLAENQAEEIRCGDNGIFKGIPLNDEELCLSQIVRELYIKYPTDGKYIYDEPSGTFIACQSCAEFKELANTIADKLWVREVEDVNLIVNPLGDWTGGTDVDTGATNRKLGSDMGRAVTGGGLHGKDLSKADVAVNIACHILAQRGGGPVEALCAIGAKEITFRIQDRADLTMTYEKVVDMAREYIDDLGGFEKLAEWGLF